MPVEVSQRCQTCHKVKLRSANFRSRVIQGFGGVKRRIYAPHCNTCVAEHPELRGDWYGAQPDVLEVPGAEETK